MVNTLTAEGLLFDLDGTLINTIKCVEKYWRIYSKEYDINPKELLNISHGVQTIDVLNRLLPENIENNPTLALTIENRVAGDVDGVEVVPGTKELLNSIKNDSWGIVTSGTEMMARTRLEQMSIPAPKHFFTADNTKRSKPNPDGYIACAQSIGVDPANCIVFEDAPAGIKAEKYWRIYSKEYDINPKELLNISHGVQTIDVLNRLLPENIENNPTLALTIENRVAGDVDGVEVVPGTKELLNSINNDSWGIVTSGTEMMARTRLEQMSIPAPKHFFTADNTKRSKPNPDGYIACAQSIGVDPANCIVFEDAPAGIKAGLTAGCTVIGIISSHTEEQLLNNGVSFCISGYDQLDVVYQDGKFTISKKQ
ncbi:hypothetical protein BB559_002619 [Furculomyces boomerangus]|uniref:Uncharacterized protein n=1 Tax=Furculomyces boomerangus TaxID=61424 RepID=A0A2T9YTX6_9FUNG|nr:hypothetical protein BB559_002619 [Furculomyces boomerangus]